MPTTPTFPSMSLLMDSTSSPPTLDHHPLPPSPLVFDSSNLNQNKQPTLPAEFLWPDRDLVPSQRELNEPLVDLSGFLLGDPGATTRAAGLVRKCCLKHGFFQVVNHGVDEGLVRAAEKELGAVFKIPAEKKRRLARAPGSTTGYSGAHADRFATKLPWKETLTFGYCEDGPDKRSVVVEYFKSEFGREFEHTGWVYQKYCEAMKELCMAILELLAIGLGVDRSHYKEFYEESSSMMRCNLYPPCVNSCLTLGTGPHSDPTSLTILHQDLVGGLEVFTDDMWQSVRPRQGALVVNLGDTFVALSNGMYKSCVHRAVVNNRRERRSLAFFLCPKEDKVLRPPQDVVVFGQRNYPDFTWSHLLSFTQHHYRADADTLQNFITWFLSSNPN